MLPVVGNHPYTSAGMFGAVRKYDIHTGLDLYCEEGADVRALSDGIVTEIISFTGTVAGSPWWNETEAIAVTDKSGVVYVYGEVIPLTKVGDAVTKGQVIAKAKTVLKEAKSNPPCMLHLEVWLNNYQSNYTWKHGEPIPSGLVNPIGLFCFWVIKTLSGYRIETYHGQYWKYFSSAIDCKSYCMSRSDEFGEKYCYVNSEQLKRDYTTATGKVLTVHKY
jgi:murein DD-endopeptidase MepM/ murein hydrolase activator NlpD